jgi:predicted transcriptional regulator
MHPSASPARPVAASARRDERVVAYVSPELGDRLRELAAEGDRSVSNVARRALAEYADRHRAEATT